MSLTDEKLLNKYWLSPEKECRIFSKKPDHISWPNYNVWIDVTARDYCDAIILKYSLLDDLETANQFRSAVYRKVQQWKVNWMDN